MARSVQEIYNEIDAQQELLPNLSELETGGFDQLLIDLGSESKIPDYKLFKWVLAMAIHLHEVEFDTTLDTIEELNAQPMPGDLKWYEEKMDEFQYGDELIKIKGVYQYDTIDSDKQIVGHRVAYVDDSNIVQLRVVKNDDDKTPFNSDELGALASYIEKLKPAGIRTNIDSLQGEWLKVTVNVYYDPAILNAQGKLHSDLNNNPALDALVQFLYDLPYGGTLVLSEYADYVKAQIGIKNVVITAAEKSDFDPISFSSITEYYKPSTGYMYFNGGSTINYIESPV